MSLTLHEITATSPASASTAVTAHISGLDKYDSLLIYSELTGATGGVLDVYIQTLMHTTGESSNGVWVDYAHFPQITAGASTAKRVWAVSRSAQQASLTTVGATGFSVTPAVPALAANTIVGGEWGGWWRMVFVAGASTSAGAVQVLRVLGRRNTFR